ncbi:MAG TPA: MMPL family transporter, partial [Longimicrobium sp.]|nr:MMPL family transporter [Longimicrobium sp.]
MPAQPTEQHTLSMRSQRLLFRVLHAVARRPRTTLLALLVAVAPLAMAGSALTPDNSLAVWFVRDDPALERYRAFQREFGNDETVAISYTAPGGALAPAEAQLQRRAAERLRAVEGIDQVLAPALLADSIGTSPQAREYLYRAGLISRDGRTATLLARMSARPDIDEVRGDILDHVRATAGATLGADGRALHYAGIGVVYDALNRQTIKDSGIYLGIAFVVMGILLWFALRRWRAVALALVPPVIVSVMTTGLFVLTGRPFTQVTSILPMLVLVIGLSDAIHLVAHYYAERRASPGPMAKDARREMVARTAAWVALPNFFTALTTAAGFLALASSRMPAIRDLGVFAAISMLILWVMTLLVGTAALALWDVPPPPERAQGGRLDNGLAWLSIHVPRWRWAVLGGMTVITAFLLVGAARVKADTYTLQLLPPDHVARSDSRWIEQNAGFYTPLEFVVRVDSGRSAADPEVLRRLAEWQRRAEERPDVVRTFGVTQLAAIGRAAPGGGYVTADGRDARVTAFIPMTSTAGFAKTVDGLETLGRDVLGGAGVGSVQASGYLPLYLRIVEYVVSGTIWGLAISTLIVFAMVGVLLRSLPLTVAAIPTNLFPVALVFGIMGWTGIPLDIATATIGAIVLGIAVDDTIHFLFRYRSEREAGWSREEAVGRTYRETGRSVVFASMVLAIGFAVLATSSS